MDCAHLIGGTVHLHRLSCACGLSKRDCVRKAHVLFHAQQVVKMSSIAAESNPSRLPGSCC
jgi:hypothetical protein